MHVALMIRYSLWSLRRLYDCVVVVVVLVLVVILLVASRLCQCVIVKQLDGILRGMTVDCRQVRQVRQIRQVRQCDTFSKTF